MAVDIIIPEMGESVRTGVIARWLKNEGDSVKRDEPVLELETDKITAEITAPAAGGLKHMAKAGDTVAVGAVVGQVDESKVGGAPAAAPAPAAPAKAAVAAQAAKPAAAPEPARSANGVHGSDVRATPLAKKLADEHGVEISRVSGTGPGGRVREQDVLDYVHRAPEPEPKAVAVTTAPSLAPRAASAPAVSASGARRERVSPLRTRIAQRLVEAQHTAAMLTTFNEVDMSAVMALRTRYKEEFEKKHGVGLGFMSFFVKAAVHALQKFPLVNASLAQGADGSLEVEHHEGAHIAMAVSTPKGLTVPVLRNCERRSFADIEAGIKELAAKARDGKLALDDLQGGTFTITNGGVFGSLLSTPILNAPQSAILGMHAIKNRPVENPDKPGEIVLRPMMYLAVSYDHRLLDGSEAVQFLVAIKNAIEKPERVLLGV
ncbi:MAG: 2-oxoglutarate dehydrogenase complex dihydrolipoyllysine-residue succinyltransferase [Phycisphaerales bacterium]